jgi:hypothetical protein
MAVQGGARRAPAPRSRGACAAEARPRSSEAECAGHPSSALSATAIQVGSPVEELKTCVAQKVSGSSHQQTACKGAEAHRFRGARAAGCAAGCPMGARRRNAPADCAHEKGLQTQAFPEAAEGIRTLDLLHGKQGVRRRLATDIPCNAQNSRDVGIVP